MEGWMEVMEVTEVTVFCGCREIRNVELLKLRFGESHMHYCEVMLKVTWRSQPNVARLQRPVVF